jgi:hypothetical protein
MARYDLSALALSHGSGTAAFQLSGFEGQKFAARCEFDAAAGHGELPAVLLQELEAGPQYNVSLHGTSHAHAKVGAWEIEAQLFGVAGPMSPFSLWPAAFR